MYCVLCDIHSNLEALSAVIDAASEAGAERFLFVGDAVGYGPDPNQCVRTIMTLATAAVAGNHDRAVVAGMDISWFNRDARRAIEWTASQLEPELAAYLKSLPAKLMYEAILLAHGSPRDPIEEYVLDTWSAANNFHDEEFTLCFVGHSHAPVVFHLEPAGEISVVDPAHDAVLVLREDHRYIVNVGSVGQPRDRNPMAAFGIYDPEASTIEFRRVAYPYKETQAKMRKAGLPLNLADRLSYGG